ncbi:c-type cytochrome [Paraburkholderia bannensis]|uniref:c-type cytochrome n=1 Tax=Paraburkholderia bannensis TaxID=765414 RepID=UPI002AC31B5B|nr:c-type cytochrome [Paraburkholderia bannensis]
MRLQAVVLCFVALAAGAAKAESGDVAAGKSDFARCAACHSISPGVTLMGPSLSGVAGRRVGSVAGFRYSSALAASHDTWTPERLSAWLADPAKVYPGNRMPFAVTDEKTRRDLVAYLSTLTAAK